MKDILTKVKEYIAKNGNIKLSKASKCKKTGDYIFLFDYSNGEEYQEALVINPDKNKEEIINVFTLLVNDSEKGITSQDYEEITIAN